MVALKKGEFRMSTRSRIKQWAFFKINTELNARISPKQATLDEVKAYLNDKERGTLESWAIARANTIVGSTDGAQFPSAAKKAGLW